ncbi:MAG: hypothetical protein GQ522_00775 [Deltaproteobacteria bacterium]|jgi:hypothetical protein|nr:hypothetical protein [Deltaproteobacteria bacterium]
MLDLLETAIRTAADEGVGEFLEDPGAAEWTARFHAKTTLSTDELNSRSMETAHPGVSEIVAEFILSRRETL